MWFVGELLIMLIVIRGKISFKYCLVLLSFLGMKECLGFLVLLYFDVDVCFDVWCKFISFINI